MLADLIHRHKDIVAAWTVLQMDHDGNNVRFKAKIEFTDRSTLFIRQVVIDGACFKYSYHWQDGKGNFVSRWDNAPHWPGLATHPYHKHLDQNGMPVEDRHGGDLSAVFQDISNIIKT